MPCRDNSPAHFKYSTFVVPFPCIFHISWSLSAVSKTSKMNLTLYSNLNIGKKFLKIVQKSKTVSRQI
jgi:hypothetical protein